MERIIILKNMDAGGSITLPVTPKSYPMSVGRPVETPPPQASSYTVVRGDSLWAICKRVYGDSSLAYKLATANGIKNPNLIYPGQVLTLPDKGMLAGYAATKAPTAAETGAWPQAAPSEQPIAPKAGSNERVSRELELQLIRAQIRLK